MLWQSGWLGKPIIQSRFQFTLNRGSKTKVVAVVVVGAGGCHAECNFVLTLYTAAPIPKPTEPMMSA